MGVVAEVVVVETIVEVMVKSAVAASAVAIAVVMMMMMMMRWWWCCCCCCYSMSEIKSAFCKTIVTIENVNKEAQKQPNKSIVRRHK